MQQRLLLKRIIITRKIILISHHKNLVCNHILICFSLYRLFPARTPMVKTPDYWNLEHHVGNVAPGLARSALSQGAYQIAALGTTLAFAVFGGLFTGN